MQKVPPEMFSPGNSSSLMRTSSGVPAWFSGSTDVASASTADLTSVNTPAVSITGTTTITSLGVPSVSGDVKYVRFTGALTLTHDANLIALPTGANIVTRAEDRMLIVSRAGAGWRVYNYMRADGTPVAPGCAIDRAYAEYTASTGLTTVIPADDTIPQNTEGTQILTASITPKSTTNRLRVRFQAQISAAAAAYACAALFLNSNASSVAASTAFVAAANNISTLTIEHEFVPGATTSQTLNVRVGPGAAGTIYVNGISTGRLFGGVFKATLVVEEITA